MARGRSAGILRRLQQPKTAGKQDHRLARAVVPASAAGGATLPARGDALVSGAMGAAFGHGVAVAVSRANVVAAAARRVGLYRVYLHGCMAAACGARPGLRVAALRFRAVADFYAEPNARGRGRKITGLDCG